MGTILSAENVTKKYKSAGETIYALNAVNFEVNKGDFTVILGKSGSGKSTLLSVLGGLLTPNSGEVEISSNSLYKVSEAVRTKIRTEKIGFIFQSFNLIDELSAIDNIRLPFYISKRKIDSKVENELFKQLGIEKRLKHYPDQLSGGERQRVAIARALLMKPDVILADEPTGNLDSESGKAVMDFVRESNKNGQTFVIVTHDNEWTKNASAVYRMSDGNIKKEY